MNNVTLVGNLGADPESIQTQSGKSMVSFSVATSDGWGEKKKTNWHRCKAFGAVADIVSKYAKKGDKIAVSGSIGYREYEGKYFTDITVHNVTLIGKTQTGSSEHQNQGGDDWDD